MYFVWWNGVLIFFLIHCKFASHVLLFQDALTFQHAIALCYNNQFVALQNHVPFPKTWVICETIISILSPIVSSCVLNQTCGH
jgi:hypothetical protein